MVKSVMPRRRRARPSLLNTQLARRERVVMCKCRNAYLSTGSYFHADIDDNLLESDQGTHSRRAYGGCLLETSYIHVCTVNSLN